jgi:hypothetical protein
MVYKGGGVMEIDLSDLKKEYRLAILKEDLINEQVIYFRYHLERWRTVSGDNVKC